jgi:hypothetical protein
MTTYLEHSTLKNHFTCWLLSALGMALAWKGLGFLNPKPVINYERNNDTMYGKKKQVKIDSIMV